MTTADLLNAIALALAVVAFGVITGVEVLNRRDEKPLNDIEQFVKEQTASVLSPVEPLESPLTQEQQQLNDVIRLATEGEREALKNNLELLSKRTAEMLDRRKHRRYFTRTGMLATAASFVLGFIAFFT